MTATLKPLWLRILFGVLISGAIVVLVLLAAGFMLARASYTHVTGNVPSAENFQKFLDRDVHAYFESKLGGPVEVALTPLRKGPTQLGVSYPHFYLWVVASRGGTRLQEGAVAVDAIERQRFEVTNFVTEEQARQDPAGLRRVFPALVSEEIERRLEHAQRPAA